MVLGSFQRERRIRSGHGQVFVEYVKAQSGGEYLVISPITEEDEPCPENIARLTERLVSRFDQRYSDTCQKCEPELAQIRCWWLKYFQTITDTLLVKPSVPVKNDVWTVRTSTMFIDDIRQVLIDGSGLENECYCTGILDTGQNLAIPLKISPVKLARQSHVIAEGHALSIYRILSEYDRWGHPTLLFCHCHPGCGSESTRPSGIDIKTHTDLELYYPVIGAIFSQDGYVRFFSAGKPFQIEIFGKGVVKVDDNVYRIQD